MTKKDRQSRILQLIKEKEIDRQDDICKILISEGYNVTQATVSRDIRELRIKKMPSGDGTQKYVKVAGHSDAHLAAKYIRVLRDGFVSMDNAQNILVVRTVSGMAMAVAAALDALDMKAVVGSIAGDDTIMMAIRTTEDVEGVMKKIRDLI